MNERQPIANATLEERGYHLYRGWSDTIAEQLVALSHQPHILAFTPNDAATRFSSVEAAHEWHDSRERTVYTLGSEAVAGLIWFGKAQSSHVEGDYTFAIRIYEAAQGKGLARPLMNAAHEDFREHTPYNNAIWLETDVDNVAARALYEKTGYIERALINERVIMMQMPTE